nr:MAG TPA: hypothetical protein [Caudoviricetes sp.]
MEYTGLHYSIYHLCAINVEQSARSADIVKHLIALRYE